MKIIVYKVLYFLLLVITLTLHKMLQNRNYYKLHFRQEIMLCMCVGVCARVCMHAHLCMLSEPQH